MRLFDTIQREALAKLVARAAEAQLETDDFETEIRESMLDKADVIVDKGIGACLEYLVETEGAPAVERMILDKEKELREKEAARASRRENLVFVEEEC